MKTKFATNFSFIISSYTFECQFYEKKNICFLEKTNVITISHMFQNFLKLELNFLNFLHFVKFIVQVSQQQQFLPQQTASRGTICAWANLEIIKIYVHVQQHKIVKRYTDLINVVSRITIGQKIKFYCLQNQIFRKLSSFKREPWEALYILRTGRNTS